MIVSPLDRKKVLLRYGVPESFINAIDDPSLYKEIEYSFNKPEGAYFYLKDVRENYKILSGYNITPIFDGPNGGDTFTLLLSNNEDHKFIYFDLEGDEIDKDYGTNFMFVIADFLIGIYEIDTDISIDTLKEYGIKLGFSKAIEFFDTLVQADKDGLRNSFESDTAWRIKNIPLILNR